MPLLIANRAWPQRMSLQWAPHRVTTKLRFFLFTITMLHTHKH
jgi:hypothetical protein